MFRKADSIQQEWENTYREERSWAAAAVVSLEITGVELKHTTVLIYDMKQTTVWIHNMKHITV